MSVLVLAEQKELICISSLWTQVIVLEDLPKVMDDSDGWMEKESQGNPYCRRYLKTMRSERIFLIPVNNALVYLESFLNTFQEKNYGNLIWMTFPVSNQKKKRHRTGKPIQIPAENVCIHFAQICSGKASIYLFYFASNGQEDWTLRPELATGLQDEQFYDSGTSIF